MRRYPSILERDFEEYVDLMAWKEEKSDVGWQSRRLVKLEPDVKKTSDEIEKGCEMFARLRSVLKGRGNYSEDRDLND